MHRARQLPDAARAGSGAPPRRQRRGRDSNPGCGGCPHNGFQDRRIQPLCHPSGPSDDRTAVRRSTLGDPRRGGRAAEGTRLLSEYGAKSPSRVRIPPSPLPNSPVREAGKVRRPSPGLPGGLANGSGSILDARATQARPPALLDGARRVPLRRSIGCRDLAALEPDHGLDYRSAASRPVACGTPDCLRGDDGRRFRRPPMGHQSGRRVLHGDRPALRGWFLPRQCVLEPALLMVAGSPVQAWHRAGIRREAAAGRVRTGTRCGGAAVVRGTGRPRGGSGRRRLGAGWAGCAVGALRSHAGRPRGCDSRGVAGPPRASRQRASVIPARDRPWHGHRACLFREARDPANLSSVSFGVVCGSRMEAPHPCGGSPSSLAGGGWRVRRDRRAVGGGDQLA